ncbi:hypothetical protein BZG01_10195 [Labilibaculum manganireducens]|uniref:Uncharacterized protein n=1 Tax=Labilibaculum manganireducens TaxID=1940525 RepID=A0A2N3I8I9_9BACT|nr:hypothetical protein [Labilibaculum manganireducens]PKQ66641.1 hypothetical protein BZG01_10195 [Labilibaculum manganireducens]
MDNKLYNTIQELGRSIQFAQEAAKRQCTSSSVNPQNAFQSELNYKMQQYVHNMHTYLNIDRVLGFPIQPMNYSSETRVSERGVSIRVAIHHYPPVKPMIIQAPEMILELRAIVDADGRMEYRFTNYFANPTDLKALGNHLPEGSCLIYLEDGSLSVQSFDESGMESSREFSAQNTFSSGQSMHTIAHDHGSAGDCGSSEVFGMGAAFAIEDIYNNFGHNHTTYNTTKGVAKDIFKGNGVVRSARAAKFANASKAVKFLGNIGTVVMVANSSYNIASGNSSFLDYSDATFGAVGLINAGALQWTTYGIPVVGQAVAIYSGVRLFYDLTLDMTKFYMENDINPGMQFIYFKE